MEGILWEVQADGAAAQRSTDSETRLVISSREGEVNCERGCKTGRNLLSPHRRFLEVAPEEFCLATVRRGEDLEK